MKKKYLILSICISVLINSGYSQQWGLYTLYSPQNTTKAYLIDTLDSPATYKTWTFSSSDKTGYSSYLLKGDTLLRSVSVSNSQFSGGGATGKVEKVLWDGTIAWAYTHSSSTYCLHHDICPMPNGNVLLISYELKTAAEAVLAGCSQSTEIWSEKIIEVQPTGSSSGNIVWEWHLWNHLCQNYNSQKNNYVTSIVQNPGKLNINYKTGKDWLHMNGIDYNADLDQIVFSSHNMNEIYVIDHSTTTAEAAGSTGGNCGKGGDFLYRWGNPTAYGASGTTIFNVVHDAHWVPYDCPKAGYLAGFNNKGGTSSKACVDLISPPLVTSNNTYSITLGSSYLPSTYSYRYNSSYTSSNMGNSQQLPNGNMLVCVPSNSAAYIFEINSSGTTLWSKTISGSVAQAFRYSKCYVRGPVAKAVADDSEICEGTQVNLTSSAVSPTETSPSYTYSWSSTPSGFSSSSQNNSVTPTVTTTYTVVITNSSLGCSDQSSVIVNVHSNPQAPTISTSGLNLVSSAASGNQWYFEGSILTGETNQIIQPSQSGNYQVAVTDQYGCTSPLSDVYTVVNAAINASYENKEISVYPNPTTGIININGINNIEEITVYNVIGSIVAKPDISNYIDLSSYNDGIYNIRIQTLNGNLLNKKIILSKSK